MNTIKLDNWDFAVIYYVKQEPKQTFHEIKQIWADRCGMDIEYITMECLVAHFLPIVIQLNPNSLNYSISSIITDAAPCNKWRFRDMDAQNDGADATIEYFNNIFRVICSRLRLCNAKSLEGFDEYFAQRKANSVLV